MNHKYEIEIQIKGQLPIVFETGREACEYLFKARPDSRRDIMVNVKATNEFGENVPCYVNDAFSLQSFSKLEIAFKRELSGGGFAVGYDSWTTTNQQTEYSFYSFNKEDLERLQVSQFLS